MSIFNVMRLFFLCFLLCSLFFVSAAQSRWDNKNYKTITVSNFRSQAIFQQKLDKNLDYGLLNATLFFLTNEFRTKNRKNPLSYHVALEIMAWNHAVKMGQLGFFGHENPKEPKRKKLENRAEFAGIVNPFLGETLSYVVNEKVDSYLSICEKFISQLKANKEQQDLMLSEDALQFGCGVFFSQNKWYAVQVFQSFEEVNSKTATDKLPN